MSHKGRKRLERKKPLTRKKQAEAFKALTRSKPLAQGKPLERRKALKTAATKAPRTAADRQASEAWYRRTLHRARVRESKTVAFVCPVCGKHRRETEMEAHHVISQEAIRKHVNGLGLPLAEALVVLRRLLWDARNGLPVCRRCHSRHTSAVERIPRALLDRKHEQFARELGVEHHLDRYA